MFNFLKPKATLTEQELNAGLRWMTWEGTVSMGFFSITTSGILVAFALALGADNIHIGVLAAIPFIMQIIQIPAVWLVEHTRRRKLIALLSWLPAQLCWFAIALIPFFLPVPSTAAISILLGILAFRGILVAISNSAFNSWMRDLVPQAILGRFFSKRMAYATLSAVIFSLGAAFFIDYWQNSLTAENGVFGYTYAILFGAVFLGLASPVFMALMPEPLMQSVTGPQPPLKQRLMAPLRDPNFRRLLQFLFYWSFSSNLAIPFFAVHMLQKLGMPVTWVIGLSVLSQMFNIMFLRVWGPFADRFGNKAVLSVGVSLYLMVIAGWIFTTMPEKYFLTIPLLIMLHIFAGIANAAVAFTVGTIGLKLSPSGEATSYLATASLATSLGAGLGPILGGLFADFFSVRQLNLTFTWIDPASTIHLPFLSIIGRDFLFGIAFLLGLITLGILARIREEGEVERDVIMESLLSPMREISRPMSMVPGYTFLSNFPSVFLKRIPVPGLDIALGVTVYQIAELARATAVAAINGRRVTDKITTGFSSNIRHIIGRSRKKAREHGVEIIRHTARGAMHAANENPQKMEQLVDGVMQGIINASSQVGISPQDTILAVSQGIVQGAVETGTDVTEVVEYTLKKVRKESAGMGISEDEALSMAAEGALQAAEPMGSQVIAEVVDAVPDENLPSESVDSEEYRT
ncbi:MFS transporter [Chloroflexota bacterium]